jgi:hypothetical protein
MILKSLDANDGGAAADTVPSSRVVESLQCRGLTRDVRVNI